MINILKELYFMNKYKKYLSFTLEPLVFEYKNWRGNISIRHVHFDGVFYGFNSYHKGQLWMMKGFDLDKDVFRNFAIRDIIRFL